MFAGAGLQEELGVWLDGVFVWAARVPVGVFARETCCRELLPLVVDCLKVEGELERVDSGLP